MSAAGPYPALAESMRTLLRGLDSPLVQEFLRLWPAGPTVVRPLPSHAAPVLQCVEALRADPVDATAELVARLVAVSAELAWRRSYDLPAVDAAFLANYAYCPVVGPEAPVPSQQLAAGMLLLGPHTLYPAHWHEAEELYVPLAGRAAWWQGVRSWTHRRPPDVIHHARYEPHAMRTDASPLLALYLWRSADLAQSAQLVSRRLR